MLGMAEKKKKRGRPKTGRARDLGTVRHLGIEIPTPLYEALEEFSMADQRTKTAIIIRAIQTLLGDLGYWPPK